MRKVLQDFRDFVIRGNALDLAVGVIIGGAFSAVINGLVKDLIMPPIGLLLGRVNFSDLYIQLNPNAVPLGPHTTLEAAREAGAVVLAYGNLLTTLMNLLIIAASLFVVVRLINKLRAAALAKNAAEKTEAIEKTCPFCQISIPIKAIRCPHCTSQLEE